MILYYSGASRPNTDQNLPEKSLGGYISSTIINNGSINSIFSTISKSVVVNNKRDTRLIVLTNKSGNTVYNLKLWIDNTVDNNHSDIIMAAVAPATDECGNVYFEQIQSTDALPYQATLSSHNGSVNAISVGNLANGSSIGIWLSRNIKLADFPTANGATNGTSDAAVQALKDSIADPIIEDDSNLVISWDLTPTTTTTTLP